MTDNEIIKALECCSKAHGVRDCISLKCPLFDKERHLFLCIHDDTDLFGISLDLINRQKAEIERLREETAELIDDRYATQLLCHLMQKEDDARNVRSDAIKEFAERLIAVSHPYADTQMVFEIQIKNLVKEMVGENNAE